MKVPKQKFKTVQARDVDHLDILVNSLLQEGYALVGHPFLSPNSHICQSCIKKEKE